MTRVSVIIPSYNDRPFLSMALDSIKKQTFEDYEIIVVDDGSTDGTAEWLAQSNNPKLRILRQPNQGPSSARNLGITHAKGEYIAFLDADDLWHPTKLEKQVHCLDSFPQAGLVNAGVIKIDSQGNQNKGSHLPEQSNSDWPNIAVENSIPCGSVPLVRKNCFKQLGGFDSQLKSAEDWEMWIRIAEKFEIKTVQEYLVYYRIYSGSSSHNLQLHLEGRIAVIERTFSRLPESLVKLKSTALGRAYLSVAWRTLMTDDYETGLALRYQAICHNPSLRSDQTYRRLGIIITMRRLLGRSNYDTILRLLRGLKQRLKMAV